MGRIAKVRWAQCCLLIIGQHSPQLYRLYLRIHTTHIAAAGPRGVVATIRMLESTLIRLSDRPVSRSAVPRKAGSERGLVAHLRRRPLTICRMAPLLTVGRNARRPLLGASGAVSNVRHRRARTLLTLPHPSYGTVATRLGGRHGAQGDAWRCVDAPRAAGPRRSFDQTNFTALALAVSIAALTPTRLTLSPHLSPMARPFKPEEAWLRTAARSWAWVMALVR